MKKKLFVVTGAYDTGKTTVLNYLSNHHGFEIHKEAYLNVLDRYAEHSKGHAPDEKFQPVLSPGHFCPICNCEDFCKLVLEEQKLVEAQAGNLSFIERGYVDPWEMFFRNTKQNRKIPPSEKEKYNKYNRVFIFDVMELLQMPRWGKSKKQRTADALMINDRLEKMYAAEGFDVIRVEPGTIKQRADFMVSTAK